MVTISPDSLHATAAKLLAFEVSMIAANSIRVSIRLASKPSSFSGFEGLTVFNLTTLSVIECALSSFQHQDIKG